eukprot:5251725-Amphidinium_carterae.1
MTPETVKNEGLAAVTRNAKAYCLGERIWVALPPIAKIHYCGEVPPVVPAIPVGGVAAYLKLSSALLAKGDAWHW